ncbi:MAG TPA: GTP-binding protein [Methanomicrobia archaeon]|nr:GTP-binding protein [Methanomicrobia archaeon]
MFRSVPFLSADTIVNKAFSRGAKISVKGRGLRAIQKRESEKVIRAASVIVGSLYKVLDRFPDIDRLDDFNWAMVDTLVGVGVVYDHLATFRRTITAIERVRETSLKKIKKTAREENIIRFRKDAYGKYASLMRSLSPTIGEFNDILARLNEIPPVSSSDYTVVIAGYPNVGKSSLLSSLTESHPVIASYPFTTTGINIGTMDIKYQRVYVIDTPGILDRPLAKRNTIERKAISAIRHLANILIFVIDGSRDSAYTPDEQWNLLADIRSNLGDMPCIVIQNKIDLEHEQLDADYHVSAADPSNMEEFKASLVERIRTDPSFEDMRRFRVESGA